MKSISFYLFSWVSLVVQVSFMIACTVEYGATRERPFLLIAAAMTAMFFGFFHILAIEGKRRAIGYKRHYSIPLQSCYRVIFIGTAAMAIVFFCLI